MKSYRFIIRTFGLLREYQPLKLALIFGLTLLLGVTGGFSIVLLIPMLQLLNISGGKEPVGVALFVQNLAEKAGVNLTIGSILIIYLVILTLSALLQYWKSILDARYQQTFIYTLRRRLFRKIIMADWQSLNSRSKTNHLQVLTKEIPNLANYYYYYLRLLTTAIMSAAYIIYALMISAKFTLIIIAAGILVFVLLRRFLLKSFHLGEGYVDSYNRLLKYIDDFWQTVKIAKVHSSENFYYNRFDEASSSLLDIEYRMQRNWSLPQLIQRIAGLVVLVFVVYFGFKSGAVPMASFVILILLFSRIYPQFIALNTDLNMIVAYVPSVRMVMDLDEALPELGVRGERKEESVERRVVLKEGIRLNGVSFAYPDGERLFDGFSADIRVNTITGVVGVSGQGKTTMIDIIAGLQKPSSGHILVDGKALDESLLPRWKTGLGYLPQDPFFIDGTLRENLVWDSGGQITDDQIMEMLEQVNAAHLVKRFRKGLDAFIVNYLTSFSGGECQRLALARVLLRKPSLLLLDEATSSLDPENETVIMEVLAELKKKITIVFVTHRESVSKWFDSVIKL